MTMAGTAWVVRRQVRSQRARIAQHESAMAWRTRLLRKGGDMVSKFKQHSALAGPLHPSFAHAKPLKVAIDGFEIAGWCAEAELYLATYCPEYLQEFTKALTGFGLAEDRIAEYVYRLENAPTSFPDWLRAYRNGL